MKRYFSDNLERNVNAQRVDSSNFVPRSHRLWQLGPLIHLNDPERLAEIDREEILAVYQALEARLKFLEELVREVLLKSKPPPAGFVEISMFHWRLNGRRLNVIVVMFVAVVAFVAYHWLLSAHREPCHDDASSTSLSARQPLNQLSKSGSMPSPWASYLKSGVRVSRLLTPIGSRGIRSIDRVFGCLEGWLVHDSIASYHV